MVAFTVTISVEEPTARHSCHTGAIDQVRYEIYLRFVLMCHWLECLISMIMDASWSPNIHWYILIVYRCLVNSEWITQKACKSTSIRISCSAHKFPAPATCCFEFHKCQILVASPIHVSDLVQDHSIGTHIRNLAGRGQLSKYKDWTLWIEADVKAKIFQQLKDEVSSHLIVLTKVNTVT